MYLHYEISDGMLIISSTKMGSISIPIIQIGNELMKNDAFVNSLYDKFKQIDRNGSP